MINIFLNNSVNSKFANANETYDFVVFQFKIIYFFFICVWLNYDNYNLGNVTEEYIFTIDKYDLISIIDVENCF